MTEPLTGPGWTLYEGDALTVLRGMDIDRTVCKAAIVNAYLYAPWMALPFPFLKDLPAECEEEAEAGIVWRIGSKQAAMAI